MRKLAFLLAFALVFLAACARADTPADLPIPTEPATEITTTTQPLTTAAPVYVYLTEEEIQEIFLPAAGMYRLFTHPTLLSDWDEEPVEYNGRLFRRVTDERFQSVSALENALLKQFAPPIAHHIMTNYGQSYVDIDGQLYIIAIDGLGGSPEELIFIRIEEQTATRVVYRLRTDVNYEFFSYRFYTREFIDGRWIFTDFPCWAID
jgi:hypothetical protein